MLVTTRLSLCVLLRWRARGKTLAGCSALVCALLPFVWGGCNKICDAILESRVAVFRLLPSASLPLVCGTVGGMAICCAAGARCGEGAICHVFNLGGRLVLSCSDDEDNIAGHGLDAALEELAKGAESTVAAPVLAAPK
eukprot:5796259-Amphidinium_carterae.1